MIVNKTVWYSICRKVTISEDLLEKLDFVHTAATHKGRKLTSLDLAFLGRLFVFMNELKEIPGFTPPPYPFPSDFKLKYEFWICSTCACWSLASNCDEGQKMVDQKDANSTVQYFLFLLFKEEVTVINILRYAWCKFRHNIIIVVNLPY